MAEYRLFTTWRIEASIGDVYQAIRDSGKWPQWWHNVERVIDLEAGDASGVGRLQRYTWKGVLPYRLRFDLRVTRVDPQVALEGLASGELEGIGRWGFARHDTVTTVRHEWLVRTTRHWMNRVAPIARPVFEWNHRVVMAQGARGLARLLDARLLDQPTRTGRAGMRGG